MSASKNGFEASPVSLTTLLQQARDGVLQLPDFQRNWVWDLDRIKSLISSLSRGFPIGAVMTLQTGGGLNFKPRPVEGAPDNANAAEPDALLLDGQQRLTSLFQVMMRNQVVHTITDRKQPVSCWFYLDIEKCLADESDRDNAVITVREDKTIVADIGRTVVLDLTTQAQEFDLMMFPLTSVYDFTSWQAAFVDYWMTKPDFAASAAEFQAQLQRLSEFRQNVLTNITDYLVPKIHLLNTTSKEAVCTVFEKVNTGGKPLDAFELVTAMYAADGYGLRKDWYGDAKTEGRSGRLRKTMRLHSAKTGVLAGVGNTDFLQAVSLFHTRDNRAAEAARGKSGRELPQISANRSALLSLPLAGYLKYQDSVEAGFIEAAKFLIRIGVYRKYDLPYQSQVVPLAAILTELGKDADNPAAVSKLRQWYWCGVFGELYGSSTETRIARDFTEVVAWIKGSETLPATVVDATVRADRLDRLRSRISAAYKGVSALLTSLGAQDFRTGQPYDQAIFFDENVDIHHIFPQQWCKDRDISPLVFDSVVNKTPLSAKTNRMIGKAAPSSYLGKLAANDPSATDADFEGRLRSHAIDPSLLRADDFEGFLDARRSALVCLISDAIGKAVITEDAPQSVEASPAVVHEEESVDDLDPIDDDNADDEQYDETQSELDLGYDSDGDADGSQ